jgi:hypothetical protein
MKGRGLKKIGRANVRICTILIMLIFLAATSVSALTPEQIGEKLATLQPGTSDYNEIAAEFKELSKSDQEKAATAAIKKGLQEKGDLIALVSNLGSLASWISASGPADLILNLIGIPLSELLGMAIDDLIGVLSDPCTAGGQIQLRGLLQNKLGYGPNEALDFIDDLCKLSQEGPKECQEEQWCNEEGECVPEASTLVLFAVGLLSLAGYVVFRRKEE